jgi:hypothetical protein
LDREKMLSKANMEAYLLNANEEIKDNMQTRYDKIRLSDQNDKFDPFSIANNFSVRNSYLGGSFIANIASKSMTISNFGANTNPM